MTDLPLGYKTKVIAENDKLESVIKAHLIAMVEKHGRNITITAKELGIGRATLYRHIKKYKIKPGDL